MTPAGTRANGKLDWPDTELVTEESMIGDGRNPCMGRDEFHHHGDAHSPHRGGREVGTKAKPSD